MHKLGFGEVVCVVDCDSDVSNCATVVAGCAIEDKLRHSYQFSSPASFWRIPYVALVTLDELNYSSTSSTHGDDNKNDMCNYTFTLANKLVEFA